MLGSSFLKSGNRNSRMKFFKESIAYIFFDNALFSYIKSNNYKDSMLGNQIFFRHITLKSFESIEPSVDTNSHIAHLAQLYGNITVGKGVRVEPFSSLKARNNWIELCDDTYIGRYVSMNIRTDLSDNVANAISVGKGSIIEDRCVLTNVVIGEDVWIGESVVLQEGVIIQDNVRILPGAVIAPGKILEGGNVYGGMNGGEIVRKIGQEDLNEFAELKEFTKVDLKMMDKHTLLKYYYINS